MRDHLTYIRARLSEAGRALRTPGGAVLATLAAGLAVGMLAGDPAAVYPASLLALGILLPGMRLPPGGRLLKILIFLILVVGVGGFTLHILPLL